MPPTQWWDVLVGQGVGLALFVWLVLDTRKKNLEREAKLEAMLEADRQAALAREGKLMTFIDQFSGALADNTKAITALGVRLDELCTTVANLAKETNHAARP